MPNDRLLLATVLVCLGSLLLGCGATQVPVVNTVEVTPFAKDPLAKELVTNCRSRDLDACDALEKLNSKVMALESLHEEQHDALEALFKPIARLLNYEELPPAATVTEIQPDTEHWRDPEASYPSKMVVRIEYRRGLDRMREAEDLPKEFVSGVKELARTAKKFSKAWDKSVTDAKVALPDHLAQKRKMGSLRIELAAKKPKTISNLPQDLLDKYIRRDKSSWAAVASHVISEPDLRYRSVQDHEISIQPALTVRRPATGKSDYVVSESRATRDRVELTSVLKAEHFCETLRAELRFYPSDGAPEMKVVFRPVLQGGSSR